MGSNDCGKYLNNCDHFLRSIVSNILQSLVAELGNIC